jgi:hypothetical protein
MYEEDPGDEVCFIAINAAKSKFFVSTLHFLTIGQLNENKCCGQLWFGHCRLAAHFAMMYMQESGC